MFLHSNIFERIMPRFFTDPLVVMGAVTICNAGFLGDLALCDEGKSIIFVLSSFKYEHS